MPRCLRQQFRRGVTKAALIKDQDVEAGEVRCDQGELLSQWRLRQAQRRTDGEPAGLDVEEHERAKVAPKGKIEAGDNAAQWEHDCRRFLQALGLQRFPSLGVPWVSHKPDL